MRFGPGLNGNNSSVIIMLANGVRVIFFMVLEELSPVLSL